ncbi:hypothetical protein SAMD00019534_099730 [Acytostelium subglobosum LB1]|uniref:hypothetical protein n=1 Tax=Acytostelium subglobosum LB1 TaxID=1410327 RepID=UPI000644E501|nr:hypothetical protein SAMD00019534_099730 [Acytostelium subglobosum LB1]GAM26798.1 hypothetical protein SAMD00019534_099730 [Acytostelium subglobosum LB1]|eukprot:XP_012750459.1 hypothetical protein SAMD00019534_099730 [Acytostelium subglobosum LB1]
MYKLSILLLLCITLIASISGEPSVSYTADTATVSGADVAATTSATISYVIKGVTSSANIDKVTVVGDAISFQFPETLSIKGTITLHPSEQTTVWNPTPIVTTVSHPDISGGTISLIGASLNSKYYDTASSLTFPNGETINEVSQTSETTTAAFTLPLEVSTKYSGVNIPLTLTVRGINVTIQLTFAPPVITSQANIEDGVQLVGKNFGFNSSLATLLVTPGDTPVKIGNITNTAITILFADNAFLSTAGTQLLTLSVNGNKMEKAFSLTIKTQIVRYFQKAQLGYIVTNIPLKQQGKALVQNNEIDYNAVSDSDAGKNVVAFTLPWNSVLGNSSVYLNIGAGSIVTDPFPIYIQPSITNINQSMPVWGGFVLINGFILPTDTSTKRSVMLGNYSCENIYSYSANQIACTAPPGASKDLPVVVTLNGIKNLEADAITFSYVAPIIDSVYVAEANISINGSNFNLPANITVNDIPCDSPSVTTYDQITCVFSGDLTTLLGTEVTVKLSVGNQEVDGKYTLTSSSNKLMTSILPATVVMLLLLLVL